MGGIPNGESIYLIKTDTELWRFGSRTGLDTLVVHTVNNEYYELDIFSVSKVNALNIPPGDYNRKIET